MVAKLMDPPDRRLNEPDEWIVAFVVGLPFTNPAGNEGDRPAPEMNTIARAKDMEACVF